MFVHDLFPVHGRTSDHCSGIYFCYLLVRLCMLHDCHEHRDVYRQLDQTYPLILVYRLDDPLFRVFYVPDCLLDVFLLFR